MEKYALNEVISKIDKNKENIQFLRNSLSKMGEEQKENQQRQKVLFNLIRNHALKLDKLLFETEQLTSLSYKLKAEKEQEEHNKAIEALFVQEPNFYDALATRLKYQQDRANDGLSNLESPIAVSDFTKKIRDLAENPKIISEEARLALSTRNKYVNYQREIISKRLKGQPLSPTDTEGRKSIIDNFLMSPSIHRLWS